VRTALIFRDLVLAAGLAHVCSTIHAVTLSRPIAQALSPLAFARVTIAREPNARSLLAALAAR
jgi:hypothetical protein